MRYFLRCVVLNCFVFPKMLRFKKDLGDFYSFVATENYILYIYICLFSVGPCVDANHMHMLRWLLMFPFVTILFLYVTLIHTFYCMCVTFPSSFFFSFLLFSFLFFYIFFFIFFFFPSLEVKWEKRTRVSSQGVGTRIGETTLPVLVMLS